MKKISYIICLTAILCSCNNELPIENVQELQTPKSKEDSEILSFKNSEEFLSTIENFDLDNPILTRASSSFVSAENIYEQENNENADNEYIGFLIPDEKYRNFFNKDLEIIINDTLYKATKYGTLFTHISNKSELIKSLENISEFKPLSNNTKQYGNIKLIDTYGLWDKETNNPITDDSFFENDEDDLLVENNGTETLTRSASDGGIPKSVVESFPTIGTADVNLIDKVIHFNPGYLGHTKLRFKSNSYRKLYISLYRNDYGFAVSIGLDCKVMKKLWHGMKWGHMKHWDDGIYYGVASLVVKQKIKNPSFDTVLDENRKEFLKKQWQEAIKHNNFTNASNSLTGGISNQWNPEYNHSKQENKFIIPYISVIDDFFGTTNISKKIEDALIRQGANFLKSYVNSHKTQSTQLVCISQREKTAYSLFRNDLSWNGGGYRVKETFLRYYRNIVFSIKIKGDKTTPGADLGDNDFVGKPEIVSCEAIVYTKDGDGWIGAKIEKK